MKRWYAEFCSNYVTYTFGFAAYAQPEGLEELPEIYSSGFLPYSAKPHLGEDIFYMARSLRVDLKEFYIGREERYVLNKLNGLNIVMDIVPKEQVTKDIQSFEPISLGFAASKFHGCTFDADRLRYIVSRPYLNKIAIFRQEFSAYDPLGFALLVCTGDIRHVWFSFHQNSERLEKNFGKYVLVRLLQEAKDAGERYCYLGTCYGKKSRYKSDFRGMEFYDGRGWSSDRQLLHRLREADDLKVHSEADVFKLEHLCHD